MPHGRMFADALTKPEISRGGHALSHLLQSGHLRLMEESAQLRERAEDETLKRRDGTTSGKLMERTLHTWQSCGEQLHSPTGLGPQTLRVRCYDKDGQILEERTVPHADRHHSLSSRHMRLWPQLYRVQTQVRAGRKRWETLRDAWLHFGTGAGNQ